MDVDLRPAVADALVDGGARLTSAYADGSAVREAGFQRVLVEPLVSRLGIASARIEVRTNRGVKPEKWQEFARSMYRSLTRSALERFLNSSGSGKLYNCVWDVA